LNAATGLAVDSAGNIYYATASTAGSVVTKFSPATGATLYTFPITGVSGNLLMTIDVQGNLYFAGTAAGNFAPTSGSLNGSGLLAAGKVNAAGNGLIYAAKFGGTNFDGDTVASIAVDSAGSLYLTGGTSSVDFPVTAGAFQTQPPNHSIWAFVSKLNPAGSAFAYSTFLGGSSLDNGGQIQVDSAGEAYVLGSLSPSISRSLPGLSNPPMRTMATMVSWRNLTPADRA
jgi:hypothetical protein